MKRAVLAVVFAFALLPSTASARYVGGATSAAAP